MVAYYKVLQPIYHGGAMQKQVYALHILAYIIIGIHECIIVISTIHGPKDCAYCCSGDDQV